MAVTARFQLFSDDEWAVLKSDLALSPRQADIVKAICQGMSDTQIAWELGIAVPTVRMHVGRLLKKCDVADRVELVLRVFTALRPPSRRHVALRSAG
jgi:DNA-binding NarL/FixJ family response regulator